MKLCVFLAIGESFEDFKKKGQDTLLIKQNLYYFSKYFETVYIFSYGNESFSVYNNVHILPNKWNFHRYIYSLLLPLLYAPVIKQCDVLRGLQLTGGLPGAMSKILFGTPLVINFGYSYQIVAKQEGKTMQSFFYDMIQSPILIVSDAIIVTTEQLEKKLRTSLKKKIYCIPNGVDTTVFKPQLQSRPRNPTIIYVGNLSPVKNLKNLLHAIALTYSKPATILIGSGVLKDEILKLGKRLNINVQIKKPISHDHVADELNKANVFVLPSLSEGHPKVLLEAMSCGLPVIGTDVEGIRNIITHKKNGLLCAVDPHSIAQAIDTIVSSPQLAEEMGKKARNFVIKSFDITHTMKQEMLLLKRFAQSP